MCVSDNTNFFSNDTGGYTCVTTEGGKETQRSLSGFEFRNNGDKVVFLDDNNEATVKIAIDEDGIWYSLDAPVKIISSTGATLICDKYRPALTSP